MKAALHTIGCKVNAYETEAMQELLEQAGYTIVPFEETADVYIVNTCSVTNIADRKSRQMLHRAKRRNPDALVAAAGCFVQEKPEEAKLDPAIDLIIGNNRKKDLVALIEEARVQKGLGDGKALGEAEDLRLQTEYETLSVHRYDGRTRAFMKIQDGCNQFCSYCIIPFLRGRVRSRSMEDVLKEAQTLAASGTKEIVLTGIHLSSYGTDFSEKNERLLLPLIEQLAKVDGIERIRLGSLEQGIITREFAEGLKRTGKFCPHFHLSLQSGAAATLKRMNRRYTPEEYFEKTQILREVFDNPALTTDVIVGFPGETEEDFVESKAFLEKVRFFEMHVFRYSRRQGTAADRMPDQIPESVKAARSEELIALERSMSADYRARLIGQPVEVLTEEIEEIEGKRWMIGHTPEYVRCAVPETIEKNTIVTVMGDRVAGETLITRIIE